MIADFQWAMLSPFRIDRITDMRVVRVVNHRRSIHAREHTIEYGINIRDGMGHTHRLANFTTDAPLTNDERKQVLEMAVYHPKLEVQNV